MEPKFQTSFIPKRPIGSSQSSVSTAIHNVNVFSVVATVVFLVTVITSGGLFAFKRILANQVDIANKQIIDQKAAFQPDKIRQLAIADARLKLVEQLLNKHVTASKVITLFNDLALKRMRYNDFTYSSKDGRPSVTIRGEVPNYNAVVEQQRVLAQSEYIKSSSLAGFSLTDNGRVSVDFAATVDPQLLSYKANIEPIISN